MLIGYANSMINVFAVKAYGIAVVTGLSDNSPILELIACLALQHPVQLIVGGNRFDAHQLARLIRKHTVHLDKTLERIQQARPFTCYQTIKLLAETQPTTPLIVMDMLTTFYDESISVAESVRLTDIATRHLLRLGQQAPVLVTLQPPAIRTRAGLIKIVQSAADQLYMHKSPAETFQPPLF